jgi:hypothetical protein
MAVCQIVRRLGEENGVAWLPEGEDGSRDETGYFFEGDRGRVEAEMLQFLRAIAAIVDENVRAGHGGMALGMPISHSYQGGLIKTPVGDRDEAWLGRVMADARNGIDLFPWWGDGLGADFYLGRAVCEMAMNVRWRPAEYDTERWDEMDDVHRDLLRAYQLDPTLNYPWREWVELMGLIEVDAGELDEEIRRRAETAEGPLLGYRRRPVWVSLVGGWSITIPGEFEEQWEKGTWSAWGGGRTIWFSCWSYEREGDAPRSAEDILANRRWDYEGEELTHRKGPLVGRAVRRPYEEDGERMWNLKGLSAVPGGLALCNIFYPDESDAEWAVRQWHSLNNGGR